MNAQTLRQSLMVYLEAGYHPFPVLCYEAEGKRQKKPAIPWKKYQTLAPTVEEIEAWLSHPLAPFFGVGITTDGLCVLDLDQKDGRPDALEYLAGDDGLTAVTTMWTKTASGGLHLFFKDTFGARNATNIFNGKKARGDTIVDIRGGGGFVVVGSTELWNTDPTASSITPKVVARYETKLIIPPQDLPPPPRKIIDALSSASTFALVGLEPYRTYKRPKYKNLTRQGMIKEGERNDTATSLAFKCLLNVKTKKEFTEAEYTYWEIIKRKFEHWEDSQEEYARAWETGASKMRAMRGDGWPEEASEIIYEVKRKVKDELEVTRDLGEWNLDIKEVLRIGEIFKIKLADGSSFEIDAVDIYSQTKFRAAYTFGTNRIIPAIKPRSYEKLITSIKPVDLVDSGTSLKSILEQLLRTQMQRCGQADSEEEAREMIATSAWAMYGNKIYFKQESLQQAHPSLSKIGAGKIVSALQDIGARQEKAGDIKFWTYGK
jgi:hypothetical protein